MFVERAFIRFESQDACYENLDVNYIPGINVKHKIPGNCEFH